MNDRYEIHKAAAVLYRNDKIFEKKKKKGQNVTTEFKWG